MTDGSSILKTPKQVLNRRERFKASKRSDALIVISASLVTAASGLILEDLVQNPDQRRWIAARLIVGGVALAALTAGLWWRGLRSRDHGTLIAVSILGEAMPDWHEEKMELLQGAALSRRRIARWVDTDAEVIDARDVVRQVAAELERSHNEDADDSGTIVLPNGLVPMMVAVGYAWTPPKTVIVREINARSGEERTLQGFDLVLADVAKHTGPPAGLQSVDVPAGTPVPTPVRSVLLHVCLTATGSSGRRASQLRRPEVDADLLRVVGFPEESSADPDDPVMRCVFVDADAVPDGQTGAGCKPEAMVRAVVDALSNALREFPQGMVFVILQVPKAVAMASGYSLRRHADWNELGSPWRRLVFLNTTATSATPVWLRDSQPDPQTVLRGSAGRAPSRSLPLVNRTGHPIVVYGADGAELIRLETHGTAPKVKEHRIRIEPIEVDGGQLTVTHVSYGDVTDLPPPNPAQLSIVSRVTAAAARTRSDLVFPLDEVRNSDGIVTGCMGFGRFVNETEARDAE